jgi:hypothetical protein
LARKGKDVMDFNLLNFNRDSVILWVGAGAALVGYLITAGDPPTAWTYQNWLQFASAMFAFLMGKLQTSPLRGEGESK